MKPHVFAKKIHINSSLRGVICAIFITPLVACISFTKHPTHYPGSWGAIQSTTRCSELTGRYSNVGVLAVQPDWKKTPTLWPAKLGDTLAHWVGHSTSHLDDNAIEYVALNVPTGGPGIEVGIHYPDHVDRFLMPWNDGLQCTNGIVRMGRRYKTTGDLGGRGFNKEVLTLARTSLGGLVINDETSSLGGGALLFIVAADGNYENSWYGWPAYDSATLPVDKQQ